MLYSSATNQVISTNKIFFIENNQTLSSKTFDGYNPMTFYIILFNKFLNYVKF